MMLADMNVTSPATVAAENVFRRVLVGVDDSPEGREAARQASVLLEPSGELSLLAAFGISPALVGGSAWGVPSYLDTEIERAVAESALGGARMAIGGAPAQTKMVYGTSWEALLKAAKSDNATVIALGAHGGGRAQGIALGATTTEVVHKATCPVLVARSAGEAFPRRIVVGVDGSPHSAAAYAAATDLSRRFGAELWPVFARGGKGVDERLVATIVGHRYEGLPDKPVKALLAASAEADLLVVGSRGLHGFRSLGSVSERVAHQAASSVLIVRDGHSG